MRLPRSSPAAYRRITLLAVLAIGFIIVTGAAVRLTGSGLGCPDWPTCDKGRLVAPLETHALVEFVNRTITGAVSVLVMLAVLGSLVRVPRRRDLTWLSLGLVAGVIAQIVLGGVTVLTHLHPAAVQGHFVLSMLLVADAVVLHHRAGQPDGAPRTSASPTVARLTGAIVALTAAVVVAGTVVTGTGPHGGDEAARRFGFDIESVARVHGVLVMVLLAVTLVLVDRVVRRPSASTPAPAAVRRAAEGFLLVCVLQAAVGYTQYFTGVPVLLVGGHVLGAVVVWVAAVRLHLSTGAVGAGPAPGAGGSEASRGRLNGGDDRLPVGIGLAGDGDEVVDPEQVDHPGGGQDGLLEGGRRL